MAKQVRSTPAEATAHWVERLGQSTARIERGVDNVTTAPGQTAAQNVQKYLSGVQENVNKWRNRVASVSLGDWQAAMKGVGVQRVAAGAQAKKGKMEAFQQEFFPFMDRVLSEVNKLPTNTKAQRIAKMVQTVEKVGQFKRGGTASAAGA